MVKWSLICRLLFLEYLTMKFARDRMGRKFIARTIQIT
jgi:hypothetical protein